jgi:hypothetical protein
MSSNDADTARDPALLRAEAARDAVAEAIEGHLDRLVAVSRASHADIEADLRDAGRLMARHTHRQLAANLTLMQQLMEARGVPAMVQVQKDFLLRQAEWLIHDWERAGAQALGILDAMRRAARGEPEPADPDPAPPDGDHPETHPRDTDPPAPDPS